MKILILKNLDPLQNYGDIAMTQAVMPRLAALREGVSFTLVSSYPDTAREILGDVEAVSDSGHALIYRAGGVLGRVGRILPSWEAWIRRRYLRAVHPMIEARLRRSGIDGGPLQDYIDAIHEADLVILPGGAWLTESFGLESPGLVLETLAIAQAMGKRTALLGQGLSPLEDPGLRALAGRVLRRADLITLREGRVGPGCLRSLGVGLDRTIVTGDDTLAMAYSARPADLGRGLGLNIRVAPYSGVGTDALRMVGSVLVEASKEFQAPLVPIPIETIAHEGFRPDEESVALAIGGPEGTRSDLTPARTALDVIHRVGTCRVVVTGSYHAGVFALAQGIPIVGLAKSAHYVDKFLGLADQFGCGCTVVRLDQADGAGVLGEAVASSWRAAEGLRPRLLDAAARQIAVGAEAYRRLGEIVA